MSKQQAAAAKVPEIRRADAAALWHAVEAMAWQVRAMRGMPDMASRLPLEEQRLVDARAALRRVQAVTRARRAGAVQPTKEALL